jgi:peptidoglycan/xylan/chitin deacetylase (PgdA/CDA1 family)
MYLVKTPKLVQALMPSFTWKVPTTEKVLYLTFDDGPIPEVTPWVLDTLASYDARATFFCVGDNVRRHPTVFQRILAEGHAIGNHTFNHLNGWDTENLSYFNNIRKCAQLVKSPLFRPPYGKIKPAQRQFLTRHFDIVMWDVLSGDFDPRLTREQCLANVVTYAQPGSIIVMHDSLKAESKLRYTLPLALEYFSARGYRFDPIVSKKGMVRPASTLATATAV